MFILAFNTREEKKTIHNDIRLSGFVSVLCNTLKRYILACLCMFVISLSFEFRTEIRYSVIDTTHVVLYEV